MPKKRALDGVPETVRVAVTAKHLRDGKPCLTNYCAVALAAKDAFRRLGYAPVAVTSGSEVTAYGLLDRPHVASYTLDEGAQEWMTAFDCWKNRPQDWPKPGPFCTTITLKHPEE